MRSFNGAPKPISVTRGNGAYIEFEAWFDKPNEPDVSCTARINLDPPDATKWI